MYDIERQDPERPPAPGERRAQGSLLPVVVVFASVLSLIVLLAVFAGRTGLLMAGVVAVLLAVPLLHYVTWGWWLGGAIRHEHAEEGPSEDAK